MKPQGNDGTPKGVPADIHALPRLRAQKSGGSKHRNQENSLNPGFLNNKPLPPSYQHNRYLFLGLCITPILLTTQEPNIQATGLLGTFVSMYRPGSLLILVGSGKSPVQILSVVISEHGTLPRGSNHPSVKVFWPQILYLQWLLGDHTFTCWVYFEPPGYWK